MAFLGNTPMLETAAPFATAPTVIESNVSEVKKAMVSGIGMAIGASIAAGILYVVFGRKIIG